MVPLAGGLAKWSAAPAPSFMETPAPEGPAHVFDKTRNRGQTSPARRPGRWRRRRDKHPSRPAARGPVLGVDFKRQRDPRIDVQKPFHTAPLPVADPRP